jgi:hypothetical protein
MPKIFQSPRLPGLLTNHAQRISGTPRTQHLHFPIYSADDLKYSLILIHQLRPQRRGMGDSSSVPPGDSPHRNDDLLFILEEKRPLATIGGVGNQNAVTSHDAWEYEPLNAFRFESTRQFHGSGQIGL